MTLVANKCIRVFIVEDYRLVRLGLHCDLEGVENITVVGEAEDAETGLIFIKENKPDVVLMDLGLPGMSGIEAIREIKEIDVSIKILVITSHQELEFVSDALRAGANGYCLKDISPDRLASVIVSTYEGALWLSPEISTNMFNQIGMDNPMMAAFKRQYRPLQNPLTERESTVLQLLSEGNSNNKIADKMMVSVHTIKTHVCNIFQKLEVDDRVQAAVKALQRGLVSVQTD